LIYDWNRAGGAVSPARGKVELDDETLRDEVVAASPASGVNTGVAPVPWILFDLGEKEYTMPRCHAPHRAEFRRRMV